MFDSRDDLFLILVSSRGKRSYMFKDYAPHVFHALRKMFGAPKDEFLVRISPFIFTLDEIMFHAPAPPIPHSQFPVFNSCSGSFLGTPTTTLFTSSTNGAN